MKILYKRVSRFPYQIIPLDETDDCTVFSVELSMDSEKFDFVEEVVEQYQNITGSSYLMSYEPDDYMLKPEVKRWLETHVGSNGYIYSSANGRLGLTTAKQAMAFKLKWLSGVKCDWIDSDDRKKKAASAKSRRSSS